MRPRGVPRWRALTGPCKPALLAGLLAILLSGCAGRVALPPAPVLVPTTLCPAPATPPLPLLDPARRLDSPDTVHTLLIRDDLIRQHIKALRSALRCYEVQTGGPEDS